MFIINLVIWDGASNFGTLLVTDEKK